MRAILRIFLLFSVLSLSGQKGGNTIVEIDPDNVDGDFLAPYSNKWQAFLVDSLGREQLNLYWTDYAQLINFKGEKCFHRVQELYTPDYNHRETWINMVELPSMKPRFFQVFKASGQVMAVTFNGDKVRVASNQNERHVLETKEYKVAALCYDWNLYGLLLVALPFETGKRYALPFFDQTIGEMTTLQAKVGPQETITNLKGDPFDVWKITTNQNLTFWIRKEPPYVMQTELYYPNGTKLLWKTY
ncbi:MAG: hypothetical protein AAF717_09795 [Bacteroidota bacterium]